MARCSDESGMFSVAAEASDDRQPALGLSFHVHHGNCAVARNSSGVALPKPKNSR